MYIDRRSFLMMSGTLGSGILAGSHSLGAVTAEISSAASPTLLNRPRATEYMQQAGLEALLLAAPMNVYYATGGTPVMSRFTQVNMTAALVPANPRLPIAYLGGGFEFYAGAADTGLDEGVQPYLTGGSLGDPDSRSNLAFAIVGDYQFDAREHHRRALLDQAAHFHESMPAGLTSSGSSSSAARGVRGSPHLCFQN
jgi:hypothetical protein